MNNGPVAIGLTLLITASLFGEKHKQATFSDRIDQIRPSLVRITSHTLGQRGTGFFVNAEGLVVTANHVVSGLDGTVDQKITIDLPLEDTDTAVIHVHESFLNVTATVLAADKIHDIVILKPDRNPLSPDFKAPVMIKAPGFSGPPLGPRSPVVLDPHRLKNGEQIFISGYPLALAVLITTSGAIASSGAVDIDPQFHVKDIYWADIRANHGNSGGPVFSLDTCKVVGMQVAVALADAEFHDGTPGQVYGVAGDSRGQITYHPVAYNSGLTEIIPANFITDLLTGQHIPF